MKPITSILILFMLVSCSTEGLPPETTASASGLAQKNKRAAVARNPHAFAGTVYQELLDAYYLLPENAGNLGLVIARTQAIALENKGFNNLLNDEGYRYLTPQDILPYMDGGALHELLSSQYSDHAAGILSAIAAEMDLMKAQDLPFQDVEAFFLAVNEDILKDAALVGVEKDALLATTAIVANALDHDRKRRRRDRDWEWMTTHFAATANAALESVPHAMMMSFVTDVY